jgi:hypothetical protein
MSYLNQIFTKLIECFLPNELERNNSSDFANRNIINLLEHSLAELEKLSEHHDLYLKSEQPELLYLFYQNRNNKNTAFIRPESTDLSAKVKNQNYCQRSVQKEQVPMDSFTTSLTAKPM